jgi:hypothetical protein
MSAAYLLKVILSHPDVASESSETASPPSDAASRACASSSAEVANGRSRGRSSHTRNASETAQRPCPSLNFRARHPGRSCSTWPIRFGSSRRRTPATAFAEDRRTLSPSFAIPHAHGRHRASRRWREPARRAQPNTERDGAKLIYQLTQSPFAAPIRSLSTLGLVLTSTTREIFRVMVIVCATDAPCLPTSLYSSTYSVRSSRRREN